MSEINEVIEKLKGTNIIPVRVHRLVPKDTGIIVYPDEVFKFPDSTISGPTLFVDSQETARRLFDNPKTIHDLLDRAEHKRSFKSGLSLIKGGKQ